MNSLGNRRFGAWPLARQLGSVAARWHHPLAQFARVRPPADRIPGRPESAAAVGEQNDLAVVEAVLMIAREPLSTRKIAHFARLPDATRARTILRQLNASYDSSGRAFRAEETAGGFQLMTRPMFAAWLRRLEHVPREVRLSAPALETLAVVAYRQPAARAEIEAIRGVNCGEILRQLMERDLVRIQGRSDELGRPFLYGTTRRFLQLFGLKSLDKLPPVISIRDAAASPPDPAFTHDGTSEEDSDVSVSIRPWSPDELFEDDEKSNLVATAPRAFSDEDADVPDDADEDADEDDDWEDDEDDDFDDDEDDEDDEEFDDDEDDEDWDDEDDEDWEEVEDDDEDDDWDDEDELDDDEDDDWDDDDDEDEEEAEDEGGEDWA